MPQPSRLSIKYYSDIVREFKTYHNIGVDIQPSREERHLMKINYETPLEVIQDELNWRGVNDYNLKGDECLVLNEKLSQIIGSLPSGGDTWLRLQDTLAGLKVILSTNNLTRESLQEILLYIINEIEQGDIPQYGYLQSRVRTAHHTFNQEDIDKMYDQGYEEGFREAIKTIRKDFISIERLED